MVWNNISKHAWDNEIFESSPCQTSWVVNPFGASVFSQAEFLTAQRHLPPTPVARPVSAEPSGAGFQWIFGKIHMAGYKIPILVVENFPFLL